MSTLRATNIKGRSNGIAPAMPDGVVVTGVVTATTGDFSGNVVVGGTLNYEDVTNIDSLGIITARSHVSIADSILHTGDTDTAIRFPAADTFTVETAGSETLRISSNGAVCIGSGYQSSGGGQLTIRGLGVNSYSVQDYQYVGTPSNGNTLSQLRFTANTSGSNVITGARIQAAADAAWSATGDAPTRLQFFTCADGSASQTERLRITSTGGVHFNNAELIERVNIVANKLSAVPNVNLDNGMVHYYTTNETTTANPNIITTAGINTNMATGDTMSVTILSKPNNAGYFPRISIDGRLAGITTYWSGGSAPGSAESSGVDVNVYQIIKTADETFDVLANTSNFA